MRISTRKNFIVLIAAVWTILGLSFDFARAELLPGGSYCKENSECETGYCGVVVSGTGVCMTERTDLEGRKKGLNEEGFRKLVEKDACAFRKGKCEKTCAESDKISLANMKDNCAPDQKICCKDLSWKTVKNQEPSANLAGNGSDCEKNENCQSGYCNLSNPELPGGVCQANVSIPTDYSSPAVDSEVAVDSAAAINSGSQSSPLFSWLGIVPCGRSSGTAAEQSPCTLCHLVIGFQRLVQFGMYMVVTLALTGIFFAGVMYVVSAGNENMMTQAKSFLKASLLGFTFVMTAWLIVNVVMWVLGARENSDQGGTLGIKIVKWNQFSCSAKSSGQQTQQATQQATGKQMCEEDLGGTCGSCPMIYEIKDAVCTKNQHCCKKGSPVKKICSVYGGTCRGNQSILTFLNGCKKNEKQDNNYVCAGTDVCCFSVNGPVSPAPIEKCEEKKGICSNNCLMSYEKNQYFCRKGICCIGYPKATPVN